MAILQVDLNKRYITGRDMLCEQRYLKEKGRYYRWGELGERDEHER